jgi:hypothetical protein
LSNGDKFRVSGVLATGTRVLFQNIVPFGLLSIIFTAPVHLVEFFAGGDIYSGWRIAAFFVAAMVSGAFVSGALAYGTISQLAGRQTSFGHLVAAGIIVIIPLSGVVIVVAVTTSVGTMLFIIPGMIAATLLWVAIPAAVAERRAFSSLGRSLELTKGHRWRVFIIVVILGFLSLLGEWVAFRVMTETSNNVGALVIASAISGLLSAFTAVVSTVGYCKLRASNEGADARTIAAIFD